MSRGPRDLRDLICVSRLSFNVSDEEVFSDNEQISAELDNLSLASSGSSDGRQSSALKENHRQHQKLSPDSGCVTNDSSPSDTVCAGRASVNTDDLKLDLSSLNQRPKSKKKRKKKAVTIEPPRHSLPKQPPLPPVGRSLSSEADECFAVATGSESDSSVNSSLSRLKSNSSNVSTSDTADKSRTPSISSSEAVIAGKSTPVNRHLPSKKHVKSSAQASHANTGNYDGMLCYMDATVVSSWLTRANKSVSELAAYIHVGANFVKFAHFWLTDFPDIQKREIFELELDILHEELTFAFGVGRDQMKISQHDIGILIGAIFREYPARLSASKGNFLFLDYLDILTSDRTPKYKQLLSDVKCSTKNRQYAQWLLATRSFTLVSMWSAIVNFYRNMVGKRGASEGPAPVNSDLANTCRSMNEMRFFQALRSGYSDVVHYLVVTEKVDARLIDNHERTTIFAAVMHNQPRVLQYLVSRVKPPIAINHVSDTGNTALHAATNSGSVKMVAELLRGDNIDVNCVNSQCENATPLHLAVTHGHQGIVELLLQAGADRTCRMGDLTPGDLARDFGHADILALLEN